MIAGANIQVQLLQVESLWSYLQQLSGLPGLTDESVNIPPHKEEHQHNEHEEPGEEEAETRAPATTAGSEV